MATTVKNGVRDYMYGNDFKMEFDNLVLELFRAFISISSIKRNKEERMVKIHDNDTVRIF